MSTQPLATQIVEPEESFDPEILSFFHDCSKKLDTHHDRYERIVKLSRDITIESKRIIFLLHRVQDDASKLKLTNEAEGKLQLVVNSSWNRLAKELVGQDPHHYLRGYSPGNPSCLLVFFMKYYFSAFIALLTSFWEFP